MLVSPCTNTTSGLRLFEHRLHALEHTRRDLRERLIGGHDVEIVLRLDRKEREQVVEHLPVLRGDADDVVDVRVRAQRMNDRGHLDRVGARAEHGHHAQFGLIHLIVCDGRRE